MIIRNTFKEKKTFRYRLKKYIFIIFIILIIIYFIFRLRSYLAGPIIIINSPTPYQEINTKTFELIGIAKNSKSIYINGREIQISEDGQFEETQIAKLPYTIVIIKAIDRYGKTLEKTLTYGVSQDIND